MTQADWVKEIDLELKEIHGDKFLTWMEYGWWIKKIRQILKHEITLAQQHTEKKCIKEDRERIKDWVLDLPLKDDHFVSLSGVLKAISDEQEDRVILSDLLK